MTKLSLLPSHPRYAEEFLRWRQDPETIRYNPLKPSTVEALRDRLSRSSSDLAQIGACELFMWMIEFQGRVVGQVNLSSVNLMMLTLEIGYLIAPEARGQGVATFAVRELTLKIFRETSMRKIIAYVHTENTASKKLLEKIGYRHEGLLRQHYLINGHPVDEALYGILRGEVRGEVRGDS